MTDLYANAKKRTEWGRRSSKVLGWRAKNGVYYDYDAARDCYVYSEVRRTYGKTKVTRPDHTGKMVEYEEHRVNKHDLWTKNPYAEVYKDRVVIHSCIGNHVLKPFDGTSFKPKSIKLSGKRWVFGDAEATGDLPLTYYYDPERIEFSSPPKVRTFDKEKQKLLNEQIKRLKRMVGVRSKLGALKNVKVEDLEKALHAHRADYYIYLRHADSFKALLDTVTEDDITTFYPVMMLAQINCGWSWKHSNEKTGIDWEVRFEKLITTMREKLRLASGAVSYVEVDEPSQHREDDGVEADRPDELRAV